MGERKGNYIAVIIILFVAAAGIVFISSFKQTLPTNVKLFDFPLKLGSWSGKVLPLDEEINRILGTDKVLLREYTNPQKEVVWFLLVYGEENRTSFHPPEYCYLGGGKVELLDKRVKKIKIDEQTQLSVNKLLFQTERNKQLVLYWYAAGDRMVSNYYKQQLYFVLDEIRYRRSKGALIRVSTIVVNEDEEEALRRLKQFIQEILYLLPSYL